VARCPAHDDRDPSLTFGEGDDGRVVFNCKTGCTAESVIAALGLEWGDLFEEKKEEGGRRSTDRSTGKRDPVSPSSALPSEDDLAIYREDLLGDEKMLSGLATLRGWTRDALNTLGVGVVSPETVAQLMCKPDGSPGRNDGLRRLILAIRDKNGTLVNVELYAPNPRTRGNSRAESCMWWNDSELVNASVGM